MLGIKGCDQVESLYGGYVWFQRTGRVKRSVEALPRQMRLRAAKPAVAMISGYLA